MNLLVEYCKRRRTEFVLPTNDGLCFFNTAGQPTLVCLTSHTPKSFSTCGRCVSNQSMTIELFTFRDALSQIIHDHVQPDTDLLHYTRSLLGVNLEPVYLKNHRDTEIWLWHLFAANYRKLRDLRSWQTWNGNHPFDCDLRRAYEQMTHCAMHLPRVYNVYYTMYQTFVAGRKYLLYG